MLFIDWAVMLGLAVSYTVGTVFGYMVALRRGRREGIEISLDSLVARGYIRTGVNSRGETVIYKYWEKDKEKNDTEQ